MNRESIKDIVLNCNGCSKAFRRENPVSATYLITLSYLEISFCC